MEKQKQFIFLYFSDKADNQVGHVLLTLKNGQEIKYTALYDSEEEAQIYTYEDKIFLGSFSTLDIVNQKRVQGRMYLMNDTISDVNQESNTSTNVANNLDVSLSNSNEMSSVNESNPLQSKKIKFKVKK